MSFSGSFFQRFTAPFLQQIESPFPPAKALYRHYFPAERISSVRFSSGKFWQKNDCGLWYSTLRFKPQVAKQLRTRNGIKTQWTEEMLQSNADQELWESFIKDMTNTALTRELLVRSGYDPEPIFRSAPIEPKPFTLEELDKAIRDVRDMRKNAERMWKNEVALYWYSWSQLNKPDTFQANATA